MIKLIATDLDGTLLDDNRQLPHNFNDMIKRLKDRDILFVIASGRSYIALKHFFSDYIDSFVFICDNGAFVVHKGLPISVNCLALDKARKLIEVCKNIDGLRLILCGKNGTYHKNYGIDFNNEIQKYYPNHITLDDLSSVDDDIYKIAVCDVKGPEKNSYPIIKDIFGDEINLQISGSIWVDIMENGISKGSAISLIQAELGIEKSETMAFGDFYNDVELLERAEFSFAMQNSNDDMKKYAKFVAPPNHENGVMKSIEKIVFQNELLSI